MGRKIAIVAKGGTSALAPYRDPEWEIWGLPWISYPRVDLLIDVHEKALVDSSARYRAFEEAWRPHAFKMYADKPFIVAESMLGRFPNETPYPLDAVMGSIPLPYLENSIAYMIALALYRGCDEIGLYGVHMRGRFEYEDERPSVTYLVGLAQGRGIPVHIPPGCPLFMSSSVDGRYGLSDERRMVNPLMGRPGVAEHAN